MTKHKNTFNFLLALLVIAFLNSNAQTKKNKLIPLDSTKYTIDNCVNSFSMDKTVKTKVGYQYWFADKNFADGKTLKMSVVAPHSATHAPHSHPEDEFFYVLEGKAEFYLDGKTKTGGPNTSFYCPSHVMHGIKNIGDTELKYLVIKKYPKE